MFSSDLPPKRPRSQPTRDRITAAARRIFGRDGYDVATIRAIAAEAHINPAMVMRYFGSKELLFAAVTTLKIDRTYLSEVPKGKIGEAIVLDGLDRWDDPRWANSVIAMVRTAVNNPAARERFNNGYTESLTALQLALLQHHGLKLSMETVSLMATQVLGVLIARYILRIETVVNAPRETLIRDVGRTLQTLLSPEH
jgi:AcrR family transcriptional regulator